MLKGTTCSRGDAEIGCPMCFDSPDRVSIPRPSVKVVNELTNLSVSDGRTLQCAKTKVS